MCLDFDSFFIYLAWSLLTNYYFFKINNLIYINNNKNNNNIDNKDNNKGNNNNITNNNKINNNKNNNNIDNNNTIITCKFCGKSHYKKYGFLGNKQKYKCKECGKVFVIGDNREKYSYDKKLKVIRMYLEGVGIRKQGLDVGKVQACLRL